MAGDWIKMRTDLHDDPEVLRLSAMLKIDRFAVVGRLATLWAWADKHTTDGTSSVTPLLLDDIVSHQGFADAMTVVGWLEVTDKGIRFPKFSRHNGKSAKKRALTSRRVATHRKRTDNVNVTLPALAREEKRREEVTPRAALPAWVPKDAWDGYVEMRVKIKKPMTERAKALAIGKLDALRGKGYEPAAVLDEATEKSWQGIYEPKTPPKGVHGGRSEFAGAL